MLKSIAASAGLILVLSPTVHAKKKDWVEGSGYQPCMEKARKQVQAFQSSAASWRNELSKARVNQSSEVQTRNRLQRTLETTRKVKAETLALNNREADSRKKIEENLNPLKETLNVLTLARKTNDAVVPVLIYNIRKFIELNDAQIDQRIVSQLNQAQGSLDPVQQAKYKAKLEQSVGLKTFRIRAGGSINATQLFSDFVSDKNDDALEYVNEASRDLLISARNAFRMSAEAAKKLYLQEDQTARRVAQLQSDWEHANAVVGRTFDECVRLDKEMASLGSSIAQSDSDIDYWNRRIKELEAGYERQLTGQREWQAELDGGCWERTKRWQKDYHKDGT